MAVLPMKRIALYGLAAERKAILEALQKYGAVEVQDADYAAYGFAKLDTSASQAVFGKAISTADNALDILGEYTQEKESIFSSLEGRRTLHISAYNDYARHIKGIHETAEQIIKLAREIDELHTEIAACEAQIAALRPWLALDVPLNFPGTQKTVARIGSFPDMHSQKDILSNYQTALEKLGYDAQNEPVIHMQLLSSAPEQTCVLILCLRLQKEIVDQSLRSMGFAQPPIITARIPAAELAVQQDKMQHAKAEILQRQEKICAFAQQRDALRFLSDYYRMRREKYQVLSHINQQKHVFVLCGYIPQKLIPQFKVQMEGQFTVEIVCTDADETDSVPVLLENNPFAAPVETVLETYSMPGRKEIDPSAVMAVFYYIFFGMMLSDAAYGLIMVLACGIALWKFRNMETELKKTITMFLYCGISTMFWGIMFGSYFGDAIAVVSNTFFHRTVSIPPLWFAPVNEPMRLLLFAFGLGILHIFAGLAIKCYQLIKAGDIRSAVYDVLFWYLTVGGGVLYLLSLDMFVTMTGLRIRIPSAVANIAAVCSGIGALGILLFGGRSSKNPGKRIAKGLYALYGISGYLSDILSYSRLLALGLATGVIATVFNKMGSMFGDGILGFVLFLIVFLIGHTLNIGINLLGAYVHTNRLQFVEFFGKFYEGGGKKFCPYAAHTKFYKIEEEK